MNRPHGGRKCRDKHGVKRGGMLGARRDWRELGGRGGREVTARDETRETDLYGSLDCTTTVNENSLPAKLHLCCEMP